MTMKALFVEGVHEDAVATFSRAGYEVRTLPGSPDAAVLVQELRDVAVLGIRSKTRITKSVLESAPELLVVGAYCIGVEYRRSSAKHWTIRFGADAPRLTKRQHPAEREFAALSTRECSTEPQVGAHSQEGSRHVVGH
jgi:hypothetical protein